MLYLACVLNIVSFEVHFICTNCDFVDSIHVSMWSRYIQVLFVHVDARK